MVILLYEMEHSELEMLYLVFSYKNVRISFYILRVNFEKAVLFDLSEVKSTPAWKKYTTTGSGGSD